MNKIFTLVILVSMFSNCSLDNQTVIVNERQQEQLDNIKFAYKAQGIELDKVLEITSAKEIEKSIQINVLNSPLVSINELSLSQHSEYVLIEFIKSFQPESPYEVIEIIFSEGKDVKVYHSWDSKGFTYPKEIIDDIITQLNSSNFLLEQAYEKYEKSGDFDSLLVFANELKEKFPTDYEPIKFRAIAYYNLKQFDKAENDFKKARSLNNSDIDNPMNLAILYGERKEYKIALNYIDTVLKMEGDYPKAFYFRGVYKYSLGDKEASFKDLKKAESYGMTDASVFLQFNFEEK